MVSVYAALVVCSLSAPQLPASPGGQAVLLDFSADWCGPCRSMEPTVHQLQAAGYPVRRVNVDQEKDLARRFNIQSIPCFVMVANGVEVGRIVGPTSAGQLQQLMAGARAATAPQGGMIAAQGGMAAPQGRPQRGPVDPFAQAPGAAVAPSIAQPSMGAAAQFVPATYGGQSAPVRQVSWPASNARPPATDNALLAASVRLRVEDATGFSCGSGTIIDYQPGGEALVLTCGHLFRDSNGKGRVTVDVFGPSPAHQLSGRVVAYDLNRDLGLVAFRPQGSVTVAHVAPSGFQVQPRDAVASVGCNKGDDPTVRHSEITRVNRFQGPANFSVAGQPVEGRSGGGLFTQDGMVIGVCNAADPGDQEGLFAALRSIQEQLDERGLSAVYRRQAEAPITLASAASPADPFAGQGSAAPAATKALAADAIPTGMTPGEQSAMEEVHRRVREGAEVVIIMRDRQNPQAKSEVFTVDRASPAFVEQLSSTVRPAAPSSMPSSTAPRETALEIPKSRTPLLEWDAKTGWQHRSELPNN